MSSFASTSSPSAGVQTPHSCPVSCLHGFGRPRRTVKAVLQTTRKPCNVLFNTLHLQQKRCRGRSKKQLSCTVAEAASLVGNADHREPGWSRSRLVQVAAVCSVIGIALYFIFAAVKPASPFLSLSLAASGLQRESIRGAVRSAWAGLAAGCLHTLAGADHLAALTPLTVGRSRVKASLLGALWGFGHSTGQLLLGLLMVVLQDRFHHFVPALSKWSSIIIGLTLLAIGFSGVWESQHGGHEDHEQAPGTAEAGSARSVNGVWTYLTGIVYGLQPDALFVIIPALALPTKLAAVTYVLMFVFGTVAAMGSYTAVIGSASLALKEKLSAKWLSGIAGGASCIAIAVGACVLLSGCGVSLPWSLI